MDNFFMKNNKAVGGLFNLLVLVILGLILFPIGAGAEDLDLSQCDPENIEEIRGGSFYLKHPYLKDRILMGAMGPEGYYLWISTENQELYQNSVSFNFKGKYKITPLTYIQKDGFGFVGYCVELPIGDDGALTNSNLLGTYLVPRNLTAQSNYQESTSHDLFQIDSDFMEALDTRFEEFGGLAQIPAQRLIDSARTDDSGNYIEFTTFSNIRDIEMFYNLSQEGQNLRVANLLTFFSTDRSQTYDDMAQAKPKYLYMSDQVIDYQTGASKTLEDYHYTYFPFWNIGDQAVETFSIDEILNGQVVEMESLEEDVQSEESTEGRDLENYIEA